MYSLTPEHRAQLEPWSQKWIANALNCESMDDADRDAMRSAIHGLYEAADLEQPKHIVFVSSPLVLALASSFAAGIWYRFYNEASVAATVAATFDATDAVTSAATDAATLDATRAATLDATHAVTAAATDAATRDATFDATAAATREATDAATLDATIAATRDATFDATAAAMHAATYAATFEATHAVTAAVTAAATHAATHAATFDATHAVTAAVTRAATRAATLDATLDAVTLDATYAVTAAATDAATDAATREATSAATDAATFDATDAATFDATRDDYARFLLKCCAQWYRLRDAGNQWSGYCAYLSFFRYVAKIDLPIYEKFQYYEEAAIHGGPRAMHKDFCMVSDRPEFIHQDNENRPHCESGPYCRWRDGWSLWYIHGVKVTQQIVECPETLTAAQIRDEPNVEVRRVMLERFGAERFMSESNASLRAEDDWGKLWEIPEAPDVENEPLVLVEMLNSTPESDGSIHTFHERVPPNMKTPLAALAWQAQLSVPEYEQLGQQT